MTAVQPVPLTITPEAAARIAELGIEAEVEQIVEQTRRMVTNLRRMEIELEPAYELGEEPMLTIGATREAPFVPGDNTRGAWGLWKVTTFPPEVGQHITLVIVHEDPNAR